MSGKDPGWNIENSYDKLPEVFFKKIKSNPVSLAELVILNEDLAEDLGLDIELLKEKESIDLLGGNKSWKDEGFLAQAYGGHQFGHFTMLGDGRAMLMGEHISPLGQRFDIQLKGSGRTPYSRGGDGRAGLGQMLREYIISEGMDSLGIPTTRSLAVVATGDIVYRENPLPGAILTRVAKSHIRVGTFEYAAKWGSLEDLRVIADYTIDRHYPNIKDDENPYISLLKEVIRVQASLIANWQLVGFVHGVMNTDNMTISGETIDYGPCAFMDVYKLSTVFSSIDRNARYAYGNQPDIGGWNLARFSETLLPLIHEDQDRAIKIAELAIKKYFDLYYRYWFNGMRIKLGIINEEEEDEVLIEELLGLMEKYKADFTNTFVELTLGEYDKSDIFKTQEFKEWKDKWDSRLERQDISLELSRENMKKVNPTVIPRNHQVEKALEAAVKREDFTVLGKLLEILKTPFDYDNINEEYTSPQETSEVPYKTFCGT